ncbi:helix-turn-helix transcriptional regulator [Ruoffia tabacinasalis]|uniref:Helix-turn-helix transcriptional regulator n=1 Tax=Ruoffia tabacinasalis TaxID=87458 RepID=A0A5R9EPF3_9LACT|nr:helix-turn-helix transcriptional regulator [Ruoffia tabacinasalis]TLQ49507.1 helix-turn-helix transcriptional regulator [Ruoffia tabacinasalis]
MKNITTIKTSKYISEMKQSDKNFSDRMEQEGKKFDYAVLVMKLRESLGLTQFEFAELVNKPQSTITRIENGNANPTIKTLESIAEQSGKKLVMSFE